MTNFNRSATYDSIKTYYLSWKVDCEIGRANIIVKNKYNLLQYETVNQSTAV